MERTRTCLKCGAIKQNATFDALEECQKCGAIYSRVEGAAQVKAMRSVQNSNAYFKNPALRTAIFGGCALAVIASAIIFNKKQVTTVSHSPASTIITPATSPKPAPIQPTQQPATAAPITTALATTQPDPAQNARGSIEEAKQVCTGASELARSIMTARQNGAPMSKMMEIESASDSSSVGNVTRLMVISAYDKPRYSTPEIVAREISDFENEMYLACIQAKTGT